jgi:hypothetical protein
MFPKVKSNDDCVHEPPGGKPPGKPPEEKPPQTGVKKMGNKVIVNVESTMPLADATWRVDVTDDPKYALLYSNLAYDLVAAAMAKLGVEMSKLITGESTEAQFNASMLSVQDSLKSGTSIG